MHDEIREAAQRCRRWLVEEALPHWRARGFDWERGLFAEGLDGAGAPLWQPIRFRVQSRQIYVFSHATQLGWYEGGELAERCVKFGMRHFDDGAGNQLFSLNADGSPADSAVCCYEYAFALLAECWLYRLSGEPRWQQQAESRYQAIELLFADPLYGGFHSRFPPSALRSQNPHMHLFEALLVAAESFDEPRWQGRAHRLYQLFRQRFLEPALLREFFDERLLPNHPDSHLIDPGHHYEWCWLLVRYRALAQGWECGPSEGEIDEGIAILTGFATAHGHGPTGLVLDELNDDGRPYRTTSRLWCQTEQLKALLAAYERRGEAEIAHRIGEVVGRIFDYYLMPALPGQWLDQVDVTGAPLAGHAPASTFYHLFVAFSELVRVAQREG
ncbi:AGE family epimerase/isomerase [Aeromonas hydrophila]|uniref:AGE family epimerase/isomerase n=1 Tax=Aeromonas hydrophila TaxID=644 RepID=UPI001C5B0057|nr:AGE family epimerase/isomerase [Aeromonas hydrophila]MBW3810620.1 mannose-6-phosphate isomerase [Aeromonas hydrophila]